MKRLLTFGTEAARLVMAGALLAALWLSAPIAQAQRTFFKCVDAKGRTLTADRPIAECLDREQVEINAAGTVVRRMESPEQRASREAREREQAQAQARQRDELRRDRALLNRYPDPGTHEKVRQDSLKSLDDVINSARRRIADLENDRKKLDAEMEFYKKDPTKAPWILKKQIEDNVQSISAQKRFIENQDTEKNRINARFDEELNRLRELWRSSETASAVKG